MSSSTATAPSHDEQATQSAETVAAAANSKTAFYVDPEVVRRRREEKAAKKAAQQAASKQQQQQQEDQDPAKEELGFLRREFLRLPEQDENSTDGSRRTVKLMTWNVRFPPLYMIFRGVYADMIMLQMLAQALVRRTLFPGSDMLKWKDRGPVL